MSNIPTMEEMLKAGLHFGHQASRWHPKMEPFIYTTRNGLHIVDLKKTHVKLEEACEFAKKVVADGGDILFVGTKTQAQPLIEKYAKEAGMPFIKARWIGGLITNYKEVKKNIKRYLDLLEQKKAGEWEKYTKKEQIGLKKEVEKLDSTVAGLAKLDKLPKALFVVDIKHEKTAVLEANVVSIPIIALTDTNTNPEMVTYPIPGNDDATKGLELVIKCIADACADGLKNRKIMPVAKKKPDGMFKKVVKAVIKKK